MKNVFLFAIALLVFSSCRQIHGSGNVITEKKQVGDFEGISAGSAFEVEVRIGSPASVTIEADDNILKLVETRVSNGILRVHLKNSVGLSNGHLKAFITVPQLNYVESSGAAHVKVLDEIKNAEKITLHASGAAEIEAKVDAPHIKIESSGAANVKAGGKTKDLDADASGGANIHAEELMSENAKADASGAGNIHLYASVKLDARASGAGNVIYKGGAAVSKDESGAGNVKKED